MEQGWDPDVKKYFRKILYTICFGLMWLMAAATAGLYFELAYKGDKPLIYPIIYYVALTTSLFFLLRYYYRLWKK